MPETPKSFEEWSAEAALFLSEFIHRGQDATIERGNGLLAEYLAIATLSPQTAAVPARQDAPPDVTRGPNSYSEALEQACGIQPTPDNTEEKLCEGDAKMFATIGLGAQAAVGEGELPELDVTDADMAAARQVYGGRPTSLVVTREMQDLVLQRTIAEIICRERQLRQAIAQRDEARKESENLRRALAEAEFAILDTVNSAALDVPKPESEEIERLFAETSQGIWKTDGGDDDESPIIYTDIPPEKVGGAKDAIHTLFVADWGTSEDARFVVAIQNKFRLRSLPSEPGSGVQRRKK